MLVYFEKRFYNGKMAPVISLLLTYNKLESDFEVKANNFNSFLASKCASLISNSTVANSLQYVCTARLSSFSFNEEVIVKITKDLNINKAHGHNNRSCWMIKLCSKSVVKPFPTALAQTGTFPYIWKRSNIIPIHKKVDRLIVNN